MFEFTVTVLDLLVVLSWLMNLPLVIYLNVGSIKIGIKYFEKREYPSCVEWLGWLIFFDICAFLIGFGFTDYYVRGYISETLLVAVFVCVLLIIDVAVLSFVLWCLCVDLSWDVRASYPRHPRRKIAVAVILLCVFDLVVISVVFYGLRLGSSFTISVG
jgi:hypothetical protein